jgi:hypothetical protein
VLHAPFRIDLLTVFYLLTLFLFRSLRSVFNLDSFIHSRQMSAGANVPITAAVGDVVSSSNARVPAITVSWIAHPSSKPVSVLTELLVMNEASTEERNQRIVSAIDRASQHFPPDLSRVVITDNASCFVQLREMSQVAPSRAIQSNLES